MKSCHALNAEVRGPSRRAFVRTATLGGGAALYLALAPSRAKAAGHCDVLLLTCMDYRLENEILAYMDKRGLRDNYDHVVLAGASLGALNDANPEWQKVFLAHLNAAKQLHGIKKVMVIDHRDCGAYRLFLGEAAVKDPKTEFESHARVLGTFHQLVKKAAPELEVELNLMALDGSVVTVS